MILLDTSGLLAALDGSDPMYRPCAAAIKGARPPLLLSPFVLAELDYLVRRQVGSREARALIDQVSAGAYTLEPFDADDLAASGAILDRYADLDIGLADASLVVIARRHGVTDLLTLDERHFRAVLGPGDRPFRILPADA